jgi:hypothetical protein
MSTHDVTTGSGRLIRRAPRAPLVVPSVTVRRPSITLHPSSPGAVATTRSRPAGQRFTARCAQLVGIRDVHIVCARALDGQERSA